MTVPLRRFSEIAGSLADFSATSTDYLMGVQGGANDVLFTNAQVFGAMSVANPAGNNTVPLGTAALPWSDLFLGANGVINWNNGAITIVQSGDALLFSGASQEYRFDFSIRVNPTAAASTAFISFGEAGVINWVMGKASDNSFILFDATSGFSVIQFFLGGATLSFLKPPAPIINNFVALGALGLGWADLFLASTAAIVWGNNDVTATHQANRLDFAGATSGVTIADALYVGFTTAMPSGGDASAVLNLSSTLGFGIYYGSSAPSVFASKGSLYLRTDGSTTTSRAYINTDGANTWTAITTVV